MQSPQLARADHLHDSGPPTIGALGASVVMEAVQDLMRQQLENTSLDGPPTLSALAHLEETSLDEPVTLGTVRDLEVVDGPPSIGGVGGLTPVELGSPSVGLRPLVQLSPQMQQPHPPLSLPPQRQDVQPHDEHRQPHQSHQAQLSKDILRALRPSPGPPPKRPTDAVSHIGQSVSVPIPANSPSPREYSTSLTNDAHHSSPAPQRTLSNTVAVSVQPALVIPTTAVLVPVQAAPTAPSRAPPPAATSAWEQMGPSSQLPATTAHLPVPLGHRPDSDQKSKPSRSLKPGRTGAKRGRPPGRSEGSSRLPDGDLVSGVSAFMKEMNLSQQVVSNESHVSQAVISQWLAYKYNGDNSKVDNLMRSWLQMRTGEGGHALPTLPSRRSQPVVKRMKMRSDGSALAGGDASTRFATRVCSVLDGDQTVTSARGSAETCTTPRAAENRFNEMLEKLKAFQRKHGHCRVPRIYDADKALGRWVNNIRSGNTRTEKHGRCGHDRPANAGRLEDGFATGVIGHARLNELGFCWHAKNSYIHAKRSRLYDMDNTERLLHPDTIKEIAAAMGKLPTGEKPDTLLKVHADLEEGIKANAGPTFLLFSQHLASNSQDNNHPICWYALGCVSTSC